MFYSFYIIKRILVYTWSCFSSINSFYKKTTFIFFSVSFLFCSVILTKVLFFIYFILKCNSTAAGGAFKKARVQPPTTQSTFKVFSSIENYYTETSNLEHFFRQTNTHNRTQTSHVCGWSLLFFLVVLFLHMFFFFFFFFFFHFILK